MFHRILFLLPFSVPLPLIAQENNFKEKRDIIALTLSIDSIHYYQDTIKPGPYLVGPEPGILQMYPGEHIFLELTIDNGIVKNTRVVRENKRPKSTVEISFKQVTEGKKHQQMMLCIFNPFDMNLSYEANIFTLEGNKWEKTSVLPILSEISSYETWPYVIVSIALNNWKLTSGKSDVNDRKLHLLTR